MVPKHLYQWRTSPGLVSRVSSNPIMTALDCDLRPSLAPSPIHTTPTRRWALGLDLGGRRSHPTNLLQHSPRKQTDHRMTLTPATPPVVGLDNLTHHPFDRRFPISELRAADLLVLLGILSLAWPRCQAMNSESVIDRSFLDQRHKEPLQQTEVVL